MLENRCCGSIRPRSLRTVAKLGLALAAGARGNLYELLANPAAYSGLRWGEIAALTIAQVGQAYGLFERASQFRFTIGRTF